MPRNERDFDRNTRGRDSDDRRGREDRDRPSSRGGRDRDSSDDRGGRSSGRRGGGGSGFAYQARDPDAARRRSESNGRDFDSFISKDVKTYKVKDGDNSVRIIPPTWDGAEHWGMDIYVHYQVGPDQDSYLCLNKMKGEDCPICEERRRAQKDGDEEYAKELEPTKRTLMYIVDRLDEKDGIKAWSAPMSVDQSILKVSMDKRSRELLPIDHPEDGYDVDFEKTGKGKNTKYVGLAIARHSSPLDNEDAMEFAVDHPLPEMLTFYSYEHISKVFGGGSSGGKSASRDSGRDAPRDRDSGGSRADRARGDSSDRATDSGRSGRRGGGADDAPTWESVHALDYDGMCDLIEAQRLDIDPDKSKDDEDLAEWICDELKLEETKEPARGRGRDSGEAEANDRLSRMRHGRGN